MDNEFETRLKLFIQENEILTGTIKEFRSKLGLMSYYNAAEGSYSNETAERHKCRQELVELGMKLQKAGFLVKDLKVIASNYMVSERDYLCN